MAALVWIGVALTVAGLGLLVYCMAAALRARSSGLDDKALRERLKGLVVWNLAALALSGLGLMAVATGVFLGG